MSEPGGSAQNGRVHKGEEGWRGGKGRGWKEEQERRLEGSVTSVGWGFCFCLILFLSNPQSLFPSPLFSFASTASASQLESFQRQPAASTGWMLKMNLHPDLSEWSQSLLPVQLRLQNLGIRTQSPLWFKRGNYSKNMCNGCYYRVINESRHLGSSSTYSTGLSARPLSRLLLYLLWACFMTADWILFHIKPSSIIDRNIWLRFRGRGWMANQCTPSMFTLTCTLSYIYKSMLLLSHLQASIGKYTEKKWDQAGLQKTHELPFLPLTVEWSGASCTGEVDRFQQTVAAVALFTTSSENHENLLYFSIPFPSIYDGI